MGAFDDVCLDARGDEFPEHDFTDNGECRRCGAEEYVEDLT